MFSSGFLVVLTCFVLSKKAWGMPENSAGEFSHSSTLISTTDLKHFPGLPVESFDNFLEELDEKYSVINNAIEKALENDGKTLNDVSVDCKSPAATKSKTLKETFDFCHNMTVQLKQLRELTTNSFTLISEISFEASMIVSNGIICVNTPSPLSQLRCFISLYRYIRSFLIENLPRMMDLYQNYKSIVNILSIDTLYCFFHHNIDPEAAKDIAYTYLKCN